jgi:hypothetical protein
MYATADFSTDHASAGKPLNRMKPLPLMRSSRRAARSLPSLGMGKLV